MIAINDNKMKRKNWKSKVDKISFIRERLRDQKAIKEKMFITGHWLTIKPLFDFMAAVKVRFQEKKILKRFSKIIVEKKKRI